MNVFLRLFFLMLVSVLMCMGTKSGSATPLTTATPLPPAQIHITFDDTAVRQLLAFVAAKDTSDASLDAWLDLPANKYLLQVGDQEHNLTRQQLKANVIAAINGTATAKSQPFYDIGSVRMTPVEDYRRMLDALQATENARAAIIAAHDAAFCPPGTVIDETVYLHLGGDWDAVNANGKIYINVRYWHDNTRPSWDGLNMVIAHETMHTIQNALYGNPEEQSTGSGAFLTALSKIQREGTARYIEYDTDRLPYAEGTYGFYYRAIDSERLRAFPQDIGLLQHLYDASFPTFDHDRFGGYYTDGIASGGPYYDIGHGIAKAIDTRLGRQALIQTIVNGPRDFYRKYVFLTALDPTLPKLPLDVALATGAMKDRL